MGREIVGADGCIWMVYVWKEAVEETVDFILSPPGSSIFIRETGNQIDDSLSPNVTKLY